MLYRRRIDTTEGITNFEPPLFEETGVLQQRLDSIEREAYEKGYAAGKQAGLEMARKEIDLIIRRLEELVGEIISFRERLERIVKPQVMELAIAIARKVIMKEIEREPEIVLRLTEEGLKRMERQGQIVIKINPLLKELFETHSPGLMKIHKDIVFDIDPSLPAYGSLVMSPEQVVITDMDEQIRNLIKEIADRL